MDASTQSIMFSSAATEYQTPDSIFVPVQRRLSLTLDIAASEENHRLPTYCTPDGTYVKNFTTAHQKSLLDGLSPESWRGKRIWCNPPYGRDIVSWVRAAAMWEPEVAALLLPARTETEWFQRWVAPHAEVHFIMSRVKFWGHYDACFWRDTDIWDTLRDGYIAERCEPDHPVHELTSAPFPSILAVYQKGIWVPRGRINAFTWDPRSDEEWEGGIRDS